VREELVLDLTEPLARLGLLEEDAKGMLLTDAMVVEYGLLRTDDLSVTLNRIVQTDGASYACLRANDPSALDYVGKTVGEPLLVTRDGTVRRGQRVDDSTLCQGIAYRFQSVDGSIVDGGRMILPYAWFDAGSAFYSFRQALEEPGSQASLPELGPEFVQFEWGDPGLDFDVAARAAELVPPSWRPSGPYSGLDRRAGIGAFEDWDGEWNASVFNYREEVCFLAHNPATGFKLACEFNPRDIRIHFLSGGKDPEGRRVYRITRIAVVADGERISSIPGTASRVLSDLTLPFPDDLTGEPHVLVVQMYEQLEGTDVARALD
jgi:hypothetical protein